MEFEKALVYQSDLNEVQRELLRDAEKKYRRHVDSIQRDFKTAELILSGLKEPINTECYLLAQAHMDTYKRRHQRENVDDESARRIIEELMKGDDTPDDEREKETGTAGDDTGSDSSPEEIFSGLQIEEP